MKTYGIDDARAILLDCCGDWVVFDASGVLLSKQSLEYDLSQQLHWKFACELDGPDDPNPLTAPCLPIPFTASELAAFMLTGVGAFVTSRYGNLEDGPDQGMLDSMGLLAREPKKAMLEAYAACGAAQEAVGRYPLELQKHADQLAEEFNQKNLEANTREGVWTQDITPDEARTRRERAVASVAELQERGDQARKRYDSAFSEWRRAMVHQLLRPLAGHQSPDVTLAVQIDGRYALPVRAIPFVTGWPQPFGISPDALVRVLGQHANARLRAYKLTLGKPEIVRPSEWDKFAGRMASLTVELKAQFPDDDQGKADARAIAAWGARVVELLPAGVFVWLSEFENDFHRTVQERAKAEGVKTFRDRTVVLEAMASARGKVFDSHGLSDKQARAEGMKTLGDGELNLAPVLLADKVRKMVREGFDSQQADTLAGGASGSVAPLKQRNQESRILELLKMRGYEPLKLPHRVQGKRGTKSEIKELALKEANIFSDKSFELAWQRLRDAGDIAEG